MTIVFFKGATAWEIQIGRVWIAVRYPSFWRTSWPGFVRMVEPERPQPQVDEEALPDGLIRRRGDLLFRCRVCGEWSEYPGEPEDFDIDDAHNLCGGSPWCCP